MTTSTGAPASGLAVALSIVVVSEIRKAVQRHTTPGQSSRPL